jgi:hypothetical protein
LATGAFSVGHEAVASASQLIQQLEASTKFRLQQRGWRVLWPPRWLRRSAPVVQLAAVSPPELARAPRLNSWQRLDSALTL